ncbi:MAG TPA: S-adenosylmethionine:tRNA ribosyltransferase-isomerase, partial [Candidatus Eisenbacteria bacterium]|nr:S-adenosylmethionine:tRNA ribosyltransferase-isomerase [Candidatus Eisenbacteria bacterium]
MRNADHPRAYPERERLLWVDTETGVYRDGTLANLPDHLRAFDLVVVNDAATFPASLPVRLAETDAELELRLAGHGRDAVTWWAVLFGPGSWRMATEHRPPPPRVAVGDVLWVGPLTAVVLEVSPLSPRLLKLRMNGEPETMIRELYHLGRPIQYSYVSHDLALWDVQTRYGARPWSLEMPSAGRPLTWDILARARRKGVAL